MVKWFNLSKAYGFIIPDKYYDGHICYNCDVACKDIFFPVNNVHSEREHNLGTGDKVTFIYEAKNDDLGAMDVRFDE